VSSSSVTARPNATKRADPAVWFLEDDGYELAVFHSHVSAPARPSRTDVENIGLWEGRPYLILSLGTGELAAFTIEGGRISELGLAT
jgi:proteasome lid subunit RPN8/RPN11